MLPQVRNKRNSREHFRNMRDRKTEHEGATAPSCYYILDVRELAPLCPDIMDLREYSEHTGALQMDMGEKKTATTTTTTTTTINKFPFYIFVRNLTITNCINFHVNISVFLFNRLGRNFLINNNILIQFIFWHGKLYNI